MKLIIFRGHYKTVNRSDHTHLIHIPVDSCWLDVHVYITGMRQMLRFSELSIKVTEAFKILTKNLFFTCSFASTIIQFFDVLANNKLWPSQNRPIRKLAHTHLAAFIIGVINRNFRSFMSSHEKVLQHSNEADWNNPSLKNLEKKTHWIFYRFCSQLA